MEFPMATKKTKLLQKNSGITQQMAVLDLGNIDDIFGPDPTEKKKGPLRQFAVGMKGSLVDKNKGKTVLTSFLRSMTPDGINRTFGVMDASKQMLTDVVDEIERKHPGDLSTIAKEAQLAMPALQSKIPQSLYDRLDQATISKLDQYKYQQESSRDQLKIRQRAQQQADEDEIRGAMDQNTLVTQRTHQESERNADRRFTLAQAERGIRDRVSGKRYDFMSRGMSMAVDGITRMANYNEQIGYNIQRKQLELQFRTYQATRDLLRVSEAQVQLHQMGYKALVRNTGTPEHMKSSMKELVSMEMAQGAASRISGAIAKGLPAFLGTYGDQIRGNLSEKAGSAISALSMAMQSSSGMKKQAWDNRYEMAGSLAGDGVMGFLKNSVAPRIGRKLRPGVDKFLDARGGGQHRASYAIDNAPALLQEWMNNSQNQTGAKGLLQKAMSSFLPQFRLDDQLKSSKYQTIEKQATWNQLGQRTLVDIIPGLLARQLRELTNIRTGRSDAALVKFDITNGKFSEEGAALKNLSASVIGRQSARNVSSTIDDTLNTYDKEGKLSAEARKVLGARLLRDSATNKRFDPAKYSQASGYKDTQDRGVQEELAGFFKAQFTSGADGKMENTGGNNKKLSEFSKAFLNVRDVAADPFNEISRLVESGGTESLRILGIVVTENGNDRINYERLWELMRADISSDNPFATNESTPTGAGFVGPMPQGMGGRFGQLADKLKNKAKVAGQKAWDGSAEFRAASAAHAQGAGAQAGGWGDQLRAHGSKAGGAIAEAYRKIKAQVKGPAMDAYEQARATVGEAAAHAKAMAGDFGDQVKGYAQEAHQKAQVAAGGAMASEAFSKAADVLQGAKAKVSEFVMDLSLPDTNQLVIRATDILNGNLMDVKTKKIITSIKDITGAVINREGNLVLSEMEATRGLANSAGQLVVRTQQAVEGEFMERAQKAMDNWDPTAQMFGQTIEGEFSRTDWVIPGRREPLLLGRDIKAGEYLDQATGVVIQKLDDITGTIVDRSGRIVATAQDLKDGLVDSATGKLTAVKGAAKAAKDYLFGPGTQSQKLTKMLLKGGANAGALAWGGVKLITDRLVGNQDGYLPGTVDPAVSAYELRRGQYANSDGEVLTDFDNLKGPLFDLKGNVVLTATQMPLLLNSDGKPHALAKKSSMLKKMLKAPVKAYWKMTKKYYGWLGGKAGAAGKKMGGVLGGLGGKLIDYGKLETPTDQLLGGILETLVNRLNPPGPRKGSWQEKMSRAAEAEKNPDGTKQTKADKADGGFGNLMKGGLGKLMAKLGGKDKAEEDDDDGFGLSDAADLADIKDGITGGRRRKGKLRKPVMPKVPKAGLMARGAGAAWSVAKGTAAVAGTVGMSGMAMAGTALASVASGLLAALTSPVVLVAAGVAAVGYGAYKGAQYLQTRGELRQLRLLQYGADAMGDQKKVLELEAFLEGTVDRANGFAIKINKESLPKVADILGVDMDADDQVLRMARWLDLRFKPVFTAWLQGLTNIGQSSVLLNDIDGKIDDALKYSLLDSVSSLDGSNSPYQYRMNPFGDEDDLEDLTPKIKEMLAALKAQYKLKAKDPSGAASGVVTTTAMAGAGAKAAAAALPAKKPSAAKELTADDIMGGPEVKPSPVAVGVTAGLTKDMRAKMTASIAPAMATVRAPTTKLTGLQSLRFRAYGLESADVASVSSILSFEARFMLGLKIQQDGTADYTADLGSLVEDAAPMFGLSLSDGAKRDRFVHWIVNRFGPVFRAYIGSIKVITGNTDLARVEASLKAADKVTVGNAIIGAKSDGPEGSIWKVQPPFEVTGDLDALQTLAATELEYLKKVASGDIIETPTMTAGQQVDGKVDAQSGKGFSARLFSAVKDTVSNAWESVTEFGGKVADSGKDVYDTLKYNTGVTDKIAVSGTSFGGLTKGNGGTWEQIPMPASNRSKAAAQPTLKAVADMIGLPLELLNIFVSLESNFDYLAKAGTSSATGWFQFINGTWDGYIKKYGAKYGLPPDTNRQQRLDPRINALMGGLFMLDNYRFLAGKLGREPTDVDMYCAHFFGPETARRFLMADQGAVAAQLFPAQAQANKSIFYFRAGQARTIGEVYALFDAKIKPHRTGANSSVNKAQEGKETTPEEAQAAKAKAMEGQMKDVVAEAKAPETDAGQKALDEAKAYNVSKAAASTTGPSGSTPTNTSGGAPQAQAPTGPVGMLKAPDAPAPMDAAPAAPAGLSPAYQAAKARDQLRTKDVGEQINIQQQMLDNGALQLAAQQRMVVLLETLTQQRDNSMSSTSPAPTGRSAQQTAPPVSLS
jgi:hypothetical protein